MPLRCIVVPWWVRGASEEMGMGTGCGAHVPQWRSPVTVHMGGHMGAMGGRGANTVTRNSESMDGHEGAVGLHRCPVRCLHGVYSQMVYTRHCTPFVYVQNDQGIMGIILRYDPPTPSPPPPPPWAPSQTPPPRHSKEADLGAHGGWVGRMVWKRGSQGPPRPSAQFSLRPASVAAAVSRTSKRLGTKWLDSGCCIGFPKRTREMGFRKPLLLVMLFFSSIGRSAGGFDLTIRVHPHPVFDETPGVTLEQVGSPGITPSTKSRKW